MAEKEETSFDDVLSEIQGDILKSAAEDFSKVVASFYLGLTHSGLSEDKALFLTTAFIGAVSNKEIGDE